MHTGRIRNFAVSAACVYGMLSGAAMAAGDNPILGAAVWVQDILLGPLATTVAVIAVAMVGFMMLTGRMNWKHGAVVVLGLFILFGAPHIAESIQTVASH